MGGNLENGDPLTDQSIAIRNVYVMMAYAFRVIRRQDNDRFLAEEFDNILELFAEILVQGVGSQVKRGLHRDYRRRMEALSTVRGRIDITRTIAARSAVRGRLVCEYDEYELDTLHNRILKCVMILLIRSGKVSATRTNALRRLLPHFHTVDLVEPARIRWDQLHFSRSTAAYRMLMGTCELVVRGMLPAEDAGSTSLTSWLSDDAMARLYERFIREYYRFHHPELSPAAASVEWDFKESCALGGSQLPAMRTDVMMRRGKRALIIDAKFYSKSMQTSQFGKDSVHSANLYQILSYTKNADVRRDGSVSGMLLYARTTAVRQPDLDVVIQGNRIGARTLDLNRSWEYLRAQLEALVEWFDSR